MLTTSLYDRDVLDAGAYASAVRNQRATHALQRRQKQEAKLARLKRNAGNHAARRMERARETGAWLTAMPSLLNGTNLSAEEFRDNLHLRLGLTPLHLPTHCDGCGHQFTVTHAMTCKQGGLIMLRHNDVASEWGDLCIRALAPSAVSDEPLIHSGRDSHPLPRARSTTTPTAPRPSHASNHPNPNPVPSPLPPESRGDISAHGFWKKGHTTIFDIRITDTDAPTYRGTDPKLILQKHEKEKKDKYSQPCLDRRRHFTPLVFSVDGMRGAEATAASRRLAQLLSAKWKRNYSDVCSFVRSRLSVALARAASQCLRGARDPSSKITRPTWDSGAGLGLYQ